MTPSGSNTSLPRVYTPTSPILGLKRKLGGAPSCPWILGRSPLQVRLAPPLLAISPVPRPVTRHRRSLDPWIPLPCPAKQLALPIKHLSPSYAPVPSTSSATMEPCSSDFARKPALTSVLPTLDPFFPPFLPSPLLVSLQITQFVFPALPSRFCCSCSAAHVSCFSRREKQHSLGARTGEEEEVK